MKNEIQNFTEELTKNEPHVKATDFLMELKQILSDYFIGESIMERASITFYLPNGQRIKLFAENE